MNNKTKKTIISLGLVSLLSSSSLFATDKLYIEDFFDRKIKEMNQSIFSSFNQMGLFYEKDEKTFIELEMPGFNKEEIKINYQYDTIFIKAKNIKESERQRNFTKSIRVGFIEDSKIEVEYINGILKISYPTPTTNSKDSKEIKIK